jgi:hypothetical protein
MSYNINMQISDPTALRQQHPEFIYQSFHHTWQADEFRAIYHYQLSPNLTFTHQVIFADVSASLLSRQDPTLIDNLVFQLGIIEGFSYWKLAASPKFTIASGALDSAGLQFWHDLLINGMGEYFYQNQLDFTASDFVQLQAAGATPLPALPANASPSQPQVAVFLGGGKDSAVMLSLVQKANQPFVNFVVQPASPAATQMAQLTQQPTLIAQRQFDAQLTSLNQQGYLNGHVPFSASLAFISVLAGALYGFKTAFVGNEDSSNEPTLNWHGCPINHQYSKSAHFEQAFQTYCHQYLSRDFDYCSPLRSFSELKIAQIFSTLPQYFSIFKSCNRQQQQNQWCQHCPKCLFVFLILYPFIETQVLTTKIFTHDLFTDETLLPVLQKLLGLTPAKPLECVGTRDEAQAAFYLCVTKLQQANQPLPPLLAQLIPEILPTRPDWPALVAKLLSERAPNFAPTWVQEWLKIG